jgi:hypothetical protein
VRLVGHWWNGVYGVAGDRSIRLFERWDGWYVIGRQDGAEVRFGTPAVGPKVMRG